MKVPFIEKHFVQAALLFTLVISSVYILTRIWVVAITDKDPFETAFLVLLLGCEIFMTFQGFHYFGHTLRVIRCTPEKRATDEIVDLPNLPHYPPVAVAVCSYMEPLAVIESTLICFKNLTYPNKLIYLLDDTRYDKGNEAELLEYKAAVNKICKDLEVNIFRRKWHGAKAGIINDFLDLICKRVKPEFTTLDYQLDRPNDTPKYLAIFDADMNPLPDFAEHLVQKMETDEKLAFVQTPQYYSNGYKNRIAHGAAMQQTIFYEYICEGKSLRDVMPCCGTNVIFRVEALDAVGGMDVSSVTEDLATSLKLHINGWKSEYSPHICAFGMGPHDLAGYFKQQFRWSSGSVGLLRNVIAQMFKSPVALPLHKWFEYTASVSYYCVGWVWLIMWLTPILYIFFGFPKALAQPGLLLAIFLPYFSCSIFILIYSLTRKQHRVRDVILGMTLNAICFPVYMKASLLGILGVKGAFNVTPKEGSASLPLWKLWPQLAAISVSVLAIVWGINHIYYGKWSAAAMVANMIWCAYNAMILSLVLYFNHPTKSRNPFQR